MSAKQYDRIELLDTAIELFRRNGYSDTSTADLVEALGVNRKSMYAEFGSKQGLFEAALERYDQHHLSGVLAPIEAADAGADAIRTAFAGYADASEGWASGRGCLMCNTAVERAALDPGARRFVDAYLARVEAAFRHALDNANEAGEVDPSADLDELAAFFTMSLVGVSAAIRAQVPPAQLHAACRVVTSLLDARVEADA
ncbi:MAG: TetR family transcriptional regulator [Actinomycetota bacterium]